jgi:hypothetical protein
MARHRPLAQPLRLAAAGAFSCLALSGCAVVTVGTAAVGLAADVAVGTAKVIGKGVGKAYDVMTDDGNDGSGITIRYRESAPPVPSEVASAPDP